MRVMLVTAGLLTCSNVFMTFAWYAHLRDLRGKAWYVAALISWSIALDTRPREPLRRLAPVA